MTWRSVRASSHQGADAPRSPSDRRRRPVRASIVLLAVVVGWLSLSARAPAQDEDKEKADLKATRILLDKAEDEYRTFFKRPETTFEFWAAIKFEIDVGKFDLAALHLR